MIPIPQSSDRQGLMRLLAADITQVAPDQVQINLPHHPEVSQQRGYV